MKPKFGDVLRDTRNGDLIMVINREQAEIHGWRRHEDNMHVVLHLARNVHAYNGSCWSWLSLPNRFWKQID